MSVFGSKAKSVATIVAPLKKMIEELGTLVSAKSAEAEQARAQANEFLVAAGKADQEAKLARVTAENIDRLIYGDPTTTADDLPIDETALSAEAA